MEILEPENIREQVRKNQQPCKKICNLTSGCRLYTVLKNSRRCILMKHEWKKHEKGLYGAKQIPAIITVPAQNYIMTDGKGNPNGEDFSNRVAALYALAYAIKMGFKAAANSTDVSKEVHDFSVYPLEGVWKQKRGGDLVKEELEYTIMIRQPDCITESMVCKALETVKKKKPDPLYEEIRFDTMQNGKCIEILHVGAFDDEPASFEKMAQFAEKNNLERNESCHREIYLNNANRVEKSKLKTILRFSVK